MLIYKFYSFKSLTLLDTKVCAYVYNKAKDH